MSAKKVRNHPPGAPDLLSALSVVLLLLAFSLGTVGHAESSFSSLGYGLLQDGSGARSSAIGLVSLAMPDTLTLDLHATALWQGPQTARFGLQGNLVRTSVEDNSGSDNSDIAGLVGAAMAIPIGYNSFFGIAVSPYTRMEYKWKVNDELWTETAETFQGQGGLTQGITGFSIPVGKNFRLGLGARAIFGKNEKNWSINFDEDNAFSTSRTVSDRYKGFGGTISGFMQLESGWSAGFLLNTPVAVRVQRQEIILRGSAFEVDSTFEFDDKYDLPLDVSFGLGRSINRHNIAVEAAWHGWNAVEKPELLANTYSDALRLSAGWEYSPDYRPLDPRWKALIYRGGIYMIDNYAKNSLDNLARQYAVTLGLGIPYFQGNSRIDIALEFGMMGSKEDDGAAERSLGLTIGFNHSELWFVGRRERR